MRGLSFSTAGTTPVSFLVGELDPSSRPTPSSNAPGVVALAMGVTSTKELSVTPRALVPVGSTTAQSSVGTAIRAEVPMAEMLTYGATLTAITQGRGTFRMDMDHYDLVPQQLSERILSTAKRPTGEEEE